MEYRELTPEYDLRLAELIRRNLKAHGLDIPGTVYFDEGLEHLSEFYQADLARRAYLILVDDGEADDARGVKEADGDGGADAAALTPELVGGIGLAEFDGFESCAELQKLYLADRVKGNGLGYQLIQRIEDEARKRGYQRMYLETHSNLQAAIHVYERAGYQRIDRPASVMHGSMDHFYLKEL